MYLVFDIGGTKSRFAITQDFKTFVEEPKIFYTKKNYNEELETITSEINYTNIKAIAGGFPGILKNEQLTFAPNLQDYIQKDIKNDFKKLFKDATSHFFNDAKLAALGEAIYGAGKDKKSVCYLTFGTGIGGGITVNKQIDFSRNFEPGHMLRNEESNITFEESISGGAIRKMFNGQTPDKSDRAFWNNIEKGMATLLVNIYMLTQVDLFILGGGIVVNGNVNLENVKNYYKQISKINEIPEIRTSLLGDLSGLYGAMSVLKEIYGLD